MAKRLESTSTSGLRPLMQWMTGAAIVGAISVCVSYLPIARHSVVGWIDWIGWLVPSVGRISGGMPNAEIGKIILAPQWIFAPAYIFVWFYYVAPWSHEMRNFAVERSRTLTRPKRFIGLPIAILILGAWLLGDVGVIEFPTFFNGKFLYPISEAVPLLALIPKSSISLAIYAWISPWAEVWAVWTFLSFLCNGKIYFTSRA